MGEIMRWSMFVCNGPRHTTCCNKQYSSWAYTALYCDSPTLPLQSLAYFVGAGYTLKPAGLVLGSKSAAGGLVEEMLDVANQCTCLPLMQSILYVYILLEKHRLIVVHIIHMYTHLIHTVSHRTYSRLMNESLSRLMLQVTDLLRLHQFQFYSAVHS